MDGARGPAPRIHPPSVPVTSRTMTMRGPLLSLLMASLAGCASAARPVRAPAPGVDAAAVADSANVRLRNLGEGLRLMQRAYPRSCATRA